MYAPVALAPWLEDELQLPRTNQDFGDLGRLNRELQQELARTELDDDATLKLAAVALATWVPECLPGRTVVNPCGAAETVAALMAVLRLLCRRTLFVSEPSLAELANLPADLAPTIMVAEPSNGGLRRLLSATSMPHLHLLSRGKVVRISRPVVIVCTRKPLPLPALTIPILPATKPLRRMDHCEAEAIAERFQPRMLHYRLTRHLAVANSQFDVVGFSADTRELARVLGAPLEGAATVQAGIVEALAKADNASKAEQMQTPSAALIQALLNVSHAVEPTAYTGHITDLTNSVLANHGEKVELSPRAVGHMLREFGVFARRRQPGYEVLLDESTKRRIHRLAFDNGMVLAEDCPMCQEALAAGIGIGDTNPPE